MHLVILRQNSIITKILIKQFKDLNLGEMWVYNSNSQVYKQINLNNIIIIWVVLYNPNISMMKLNLFLKAINKPKNSGITINEH